MRVSLIFGCLQITRQSHEVLHPRQDAKMLKETLSSDAKPGESLLTVLESRDEVQQLLSPAL